MRREYLDFQQFNADIRGLNPILIKAESEEDFYDTGADGNRYGLVIEWSSFEHVRDAKGRRGTDCRSSARRILRHHDLLQGLDARAARALQARLVRRRDPRGVPVARAGSMAA
jgi:hypothetical protein